MSSAIKTTFMSNESFLYQNNQLSSMSLYHFEAVMRTTHKFSAIFASVTSKMQKPRKEMYVWLLPSGCHYEEVTVTGPSSAITSKVTIGVGQARFYYQKQK